MDDELEMTETGKCSICGGPYIRWGNNAEPINHGRCCDGCNRATVIPMRMIRFQQKRDPRQVDTDVDSLDGNHRRR